MAKLNVPSADIATPAPVKVVAGPPAPEAGGLLTVDLGALVANWQMLSHQCVPAECAAVVKADAYGCGIEPVAAALTRASCKTFFVADLSEARRLRPVAPDATIYVLNGLMPDTAPAYAQLRARPVIGSMLELSEWDAFCSGQQWRGGAALHVDTGMNRLGVTPEEAAAMASRIRTENHGITLIMSHLACADQPDHPLNTRQMAVFRDVRMLYRGIPSSLANSSGIFLSTAAHCDVVRPGVALYGVNPTPGFANPMRPVVDLKARIAQIRPVKRGEAVGYNASWTTRRATRLATVAIGYGDGYMWASGSSDETPGGAAIVGGKRCPIAGRISMDLITIDITELPDGTVRRGDMATLIGGDLTVDDVARAAGTIGYELLTALGRRYHREYLRP
ncbi:MAG: alanine racemase [Bradyrhizobium sp. 35-63-5]|nr:MAG: alanine racemase [Bradyrhizobium sp. 35-63-5]